MTDEKESKWYSKGKEGAERAKAEEEAAKRRRESSGAAYRRWRLKNEEHGKLTFLDNPEFFFLEHNLKVEGHFGNFFTCLREFDTCPLDDIDNPSYVVACTIIDHREWEDKKGQKHKNEKKLLVAKGAAQHELLYQFDKHKDLKYYMFEVRRGSKQTECNTGERFEPVKKFNAKSLMKIAPKDAGEDWLKPFDYEKIFAPKTVAELSKLVGKAAPIGSEPESSDTNAKADDIEDLL